MPGSKLDRWYIEEMVKKYPKQQDMDEVFEEVKHFDDETFEEEFKELIEEKNKEREAKKKGEVYIKKTKISEEKKENGASKVWTDEDVANLTKAVK